MSAKTCLRCDWQGETAASTCPNCAEPLYELGKPPSEEAGAAVRGHPEERSRDAASTARVTPSAAPPHPPNPPPERAAAEPSTTKPRQLVAFVLTAIVLAFAVVWWLNAHTRPKSEQLATRPTRLTGTLVYAVPDGADRSRLWRWDLATGRVARGPRVPSAVELVDAHGANLGWIGVTSELADGRLRASVLRFLGVGDRATPILQGDMVSWGPQGATVVAGRRGQLRAGCHRRVSIVWASLVPAQRERKFADPSLCGDLLSVGQEDVATLFTLERGGRVGIYFAGIGRIHRVLAGHALIAVSGLSDLLVVPQTGLPALTPLASRPEQEHADLPDAGLFFRGLSEPTPLPYVVGSDRFAIARVLAWSPDATVALVVGTLGFRRGLYELDAGPGDGLEAPLYVGPVSGIPYATFTHGGTAIVETSDGLFTVTGGRLVPFAPPGEAPAPGGPIVWIR